MTPASISGLFSHGTAMDVERGASGRQTGSYVVLVKAGKRSDMAWGNMIRHRKAQLPVYRNSEPIGD